MKKKRFAGGGINQMDSSSSDSGISGSIPPINSPLSDDQIAGLMKVKKLKQTYGPTQDERDRIERSNLTKEFTDTPSVVRSEDGRSGGIGPIKKMAKGGSVSSASKRADGCAVKGKTRGMMR